MSLPNAAAPGETVNVVCALLHGVQELHSLRLRQTKRLASAMLPGSVLSSCVLIMLPTTLCILSAIELPKGFLTVIGVECMCPLGWRDLCIC